MTHTRHLPRTAVVAAGAAVTLATLLSACTGIEGTATEPTPSTTGGSVTSAPSTPVDTTEPTPAEDDVWADWIMPASHGSVIGAADTACRLPVSVKVATGWTVESVPPDLHSQGGMRLACELDAKPAGNIGFIRVWVSGRTDAQSPRAALESFVADGNGVDARYRDYSTESLRGAETVYSNVSSVDDSSTPRRAILIAAGDQYVVVSLGGLDAEEHNAMLPAYTLARRSLTVLDG